MSGQREDPEIDDVVIPTPEEVERDARHRSRGRHLDESGEESLIGRSRSFIKRIGNRVGSSRTEARAPRVEGPTPHPEELGDVEEPEEEEPPKVLDPEPMAPLDAQDVKPVDEVEGESGDSWPDPGEFPGKGTASRPDSSEPTNQPAPSQPATKEEPASRGGSAPRLRSVRGLRQDRPREGRPTVPKPGHVRARERAESKGHSYSGWAPIQGDDQAWGGNCDKCGVSAEYRLERQDYSNETWPRDLGDGFRRSCD